VEVERTGLVEKRRRKRIWWQGRGLRLRRKISRLEFVSLVKALSMSMETQTISPS
jgi:hypothetical protein